MSSPKKRSVGAAGLGQYPAHFQSKKLKGQAAESTNSVGGSLSDSSDDNYPGFGGGAGTGLGFGSYAGVGSAQGFVAGPTTETTYPVSINNQQVAPQSYSSSDEVGDERPVLGLGATSPETETSESDNSDQPAFSMGPGATDLSPHALRKDTANQDPQYSDRAAQMMAKMGYTKGKGLGKKEQGRVAIIEASMQKGRRGLGHSVSGFEQKSVDWDFEQEEVRLEEHVTWIPSANQPMPTLDEMRPWVQQGLKKKILDDEAEFVSEKTLGDILNCKTIFDHLEDEEMRRARTRSNPYETIRGAFFLNRAAMKMANMDAVTGYMFTNPRDDKGHPLVRPDELLYFADVCAGPGGFSEYVLWRKKWESKGFGFTLKGSCDFKLEDFFSASSELFEPHYGVGVLEGDGDVYRTDNQRVFRQFVWENTGGAGLHFVMADGGFSVEGQENIQEILSKRLYLCQFLMALSLLRVGGHFVCKLFDIFTPFSVGLVYLMYRAFTRVSIFKPVTSRPANSERYIICQGLRPGSHTICDYMSEVNELMETTFSRVLSDQDIVQVVPLDVMKADTDFFNYIFESNEIIGKLQAQSLVKIQTFAQNNNLYETRQASTREQLLKLWDIPDKLRTAPDKSDQAQSKFTEMTEGTNLDLETETTELSQDTLSKIHSPYDYKCVIAASDERWYLLGLGKLQVWKWDGRRSSKWRKVDDVRIELPRNTLLEAEFVQELRGEGKGQRKVMAVHVVDAMVLSDVNIQELHFKERIQKLHKFVRAINRPTRPDLAPLRVKDVHKLEEMERIFQRLSMKLVKGSGNRYRVCYQCSNTLSVTEGLQDHGLWQFVPPAEQPRYFTPSGICLIKTEKDPWMLAFSRSQKRWYWYNTVTRKSVFEFPQDCVGNYSYCMKNRLQWKWTEGVKLCDQQERQDPDKLSRDKVLHYIYKLVHPS